jgi:hypothetical protein
VRLPRVAEAVSRLELPLLALWVGLALVLSALTTRVVDWVVMTDELFYERLAISVWQLGTPLPNVHGELIPSLNQLYPLLLAPVFRDGLVTDALADAHTLNAWVMSSACIPAFFLARRVTGSRLAAYGVALLTVCVPWIVLSSFLLTEVAGYPAFLWAMLALQAAIAAPSRRNDVLALLGIALAVFARTQFEVLLAVVPVAVFAYELGRARGGFREAARESVRRHRVLTAAYGVLVAAALVLLALGHGSRVLGTYRGALEGQLVPDGIGRSFVEHVATLALGLGVLPFVLGVAWALANLVRPPADRELHAYACLGSVTIAAVALEVTIFDQRFGAGLIFDRYLFYVAPLVLLGFACALVSPRWPRWSLLAPAALVTAGFAVDRLPAYGRFHVDSPVAILHDSLLEGLHSLNGARTFLAGATVLGTLLFVQLSLVVPRRPLAAALGALTLVVLPLETAYAFQKLFAHDGTSGRPLTLAQGGVFNWVDRTVGTEPEVTIVPYPDLPGEYLASVANWWDLEFWNRSIARAVHRPGEFEWTPSTFPKLYPRFDPRTGRASESPTRYVAHSDKETRFRIAGPAVSHNRGTLLIDAERPWRTEWQTFGLDVDGWTKPRKRATVRVYAAPRQRQDVTRTLTLGIRAPTDVAARLVTVASRLERRGVTATNAATRFHSVPVCVPAGGFADVTVETPDFSRVYGDMRSSSAFGQPREAGVLLVQIALADEVGLTCRRAPRASRTSSGASA